MDVNKNVRKLKLSKYIPVDMPSKIAKYFLKSLWIQYRSIVKTIGKKWGILKSQLQKKS